MFCNVLQGTVNYSITLPAALDYSGEKSLYFTIRRNTSNWDSKYNRGGNILGQPGGSYTFGNG
jgi:hypothetical protein